MKWIDLNQQRSFCLSLTIASLNACTDYFQTENKETFSLEELQITLECLQHDQDRDVKFFAGGEVSDTRRYVVCVCVVVFYIP